MLEKFKSQFSNPLKNNPELKSQVLGLAIMLVLVGLSYSAGRGEGREDERKLLPGNARIEAKLDRIEAKLDKIEAAMMSNPARASELMNTSMEAK